MNNRKATGTVAFCRRRLRKDPRCLLCSKGVTGIQPKVHYQLSLVDLPKCAVRYSRGLVNPSTISHFSMEACIHHNRV
jgi:hypothetical protein